MVRNRAKRRLREAVRAAGLPAGYDFVIIAGKTVGDVPFPTLVSWLREASLHGAIPSLDGAGPSLHGAGPSLHGAGATDRGRV